MESDGRDANDGDTNGTTGANSTERPSTRADLPRRGFLRLGGAAVAATGLSSVMGSASAAGVNLMKDPSPANLEVGGGNSYSDKFQLQDADYNVWNRKMLLNALDDASRGDVVHVSNDAKIDLTGDSNLSIPEGVTLASGRGRKGKPGGLIYTDNYDTLFKVYSDDVRVTGLRLRGPRFGYYDPGNYSAHESQGVWFLGTGGVVDNCELFGWSVAGVSVGSRRRERRAHIHHNSFHDNAMEGYGYGAMLYNGFSLLEHNYFGMNRHAICGFGYETNGYEARFNLVGPRTVSHAFDMHALLENTSTSSNTAGGTVYIHHNTFKFTHDVLGRAQEAVTIRGVPADRVSLEKNWFAHGEKPDSTHVSANGQAYRQNNLDSDNWQNFYAEGNQFGAKVACSDVGHQRPPDVRPSRAVSPGRRRTRSAVRIGYHNGFEDLLRIRKITVEPASRKVRKLADHSWGEGRWKSEVHTVADHRSGTTDVGGGRSLPGSIALGSDGHSGSPDVTPILTGGSTATICLSDFLDRRGRPVDMAGERLKVTLDAVLQGVGGCRDTFFVEP